MKKLTSTCRFSERGSLLLEALIAVAISAAFSVVAVLVQRSLAEAVAITASMPYAHAVVDRELEEFLNGAYDAPSEPASGPVGTSDAGEAISAMRSAAFEGDLGLRTANFAVFGPGGRPAILGGAARLEPLPAMSLRSDESDVAISPSVHRLEVRNSTPSYGTVSGTGAYAFGDSAQIRASPFPGRSFIRWDGDAVVSDRISASTTVIVEEDRVIYAVFSP